MDKGGIDFHGMPVHTLHNYTNALHRLEQYIRIPDIGHIFNQNRFICHYRSCQYGKRCVLGTAYLHFTNKRIPAFNHILFHINLFMYAGLAQQQRAHRHTDPFTRFPLITNFL